MQQDEPVRRITYLLLCASPLLINPLAAARPIRIPGVHQIVGLVLFGSLASCAWLLSRAATGTSSEHTSLVRLAGLSFFTPFALVALLWVGLGTPWDATALENRMRYAVLLTASIAVTAGFVLAKEALTEATNRLFPTLSYAAGILSGAAYLVWSSYYLGATASRVSSGQLSPAVTAVSNILDVLLFAASALAYLATAALAHSLRRADWIGFRASIAYVVLNALALMFLLLRGLSFPNPTQSATPWYTRPGFVAGIPAIPWLMPYLLGIVLLRHAGRRRSATGSP